jgi:hypothetical protein
MNEVSADGTVRRGRSYDEPVFFGRHSVKRPLFQATGFSKEIDRHSVSVNIDLTRMRVVGATEAYADDWAMNACRNRELLTLVTVAEFNELEEFRRQRDALDPSVKAKKEEAAIERMWRT